MVVVVDVVVVDVDVVVAVLLVVVPVDIVVELLAVFDDCSGCYRNATGRACKCNCFHQ